MNNGHVYRLLKPGLFLSLIGIFMLVILPVGEAVASSSYTVLLLTDDVEHQINENFTIEVRFYNLETPADAEGINITLGDPEGHGRFIEVDPSEVKLETGHYRISFMLLESDTLDGGTSVNGTVRCSVTDDRGTIDESANFVVRFAGEDIQVQFTIDHPIFEPGQFVTFTINTTLDGIRFTPDEINASVTINERIWSLPLYEVSIGNYEFVYEPPNDTFGRSVQVDVWGEHNGTSFSDVGHTDSLQYQVWVNIEENSLAGISGVLGVADLAGTSIDAVVDLHYSYSDIEGDVVIVTHAGLVCENGTSDISLDLTDIGQDEREVDLILWANASDGREQEYSQFVRTTIPVAAPPSPIGNDLEVILQENRKSIPPMSEHSFSFRAYQDGLPANGSTVYYYVQSSLASLHEVIEVGNATTNEDGSFSVTFTTPSHEHAILMKFKVRSEDGRYGTGEWNEFIHGPIMVGSQFHISQEMDISLGSFEIGTGVEVAVNGSGHLSGTGSTEIIPIRKEISQDELDSYVHSLNPEGWIHLNDLRSSQWEPYIGGSFTRNTRVPDFFTGDVNFLVLATSWNDEYILTPVVRGFIAVDLEGNIVDPLEIALSIDAQIPAEINADSMRPITIQLVSNGSLEGISVTLQSTSLLRTCKSQTTTDYTGTIYCLIDAGNVTGEDRIATVWINATRDGYTNAYFTQDVLIHAWEEPKELSIKTDLPDVMASAASPSMLINVTSGGEGVQGVRVTIEASGSGRTCKEAGTTDSEGLVSCAVFANHVVGRNSTVTIFLNGTKTGYLPVRYEKTITILAEGAPDTYIDPIQLDLGNGSSVHVRASIVGEVNITVGQVAAPDQWDNFSLGVYFTVQREGTGTLRWINITFSYSEIDPRFIEEDLRLFFWADGLSRWKLSTNTDVDPERNIIFANMTHLSLFAPRQQEDVIPPTIDHTPIKRADPGSNITVTATITDTGSDVKVVTLYYRQDGESIYHIINMLPNGTEFSAVIPSHDVELDRPIEYYIRANDGLNTASFPEDTGSPLRIEVQEKEDDDSDSLAIFAAVFIAVVLFLILLFAMVFKAQDFTSVDTSDDRSDKGPEDDVIEGPEDEVKEEPEDEKKDDQVDGSETPDGEEDSDADDGSGEGSEDGTGDEPKSEDVNGPHEGTETK